MVAVTGTAGKTSVASFTRQIWAHSGFSAAMIGTTGGGGARPHRIRLADDPPTRYPCTSCLPNLPTRA
ncbi:Mur ligase family protein [Sinorhizobium meliloti]|nr:Mur ligase family protein [Sinorhizobium meliloti]